MFSGFAPFRYEIIYCPRDRHDDFPAFRGFRSMPEKNALSIIYESVDENALHARIYIAKPI